MIESYISLFKTLWTAQIHHDHLEALWQDVNVCALSHVQAKITLTGELLLEIL